MKWIEILRKDNHALLQSESDTQYAVVSGYDPTQLEGQQWSNGTYFTYWDDLNKKATALSSALDLFRYRTESKYISRLRLEELATKFKDGLFGAYLEEVENQNINEPDTYDSYIEAYDEMKSRYENLVEEGDEASIDEYDANIQTDSYNIDWKIYEVEAE